MRPDICIYHAPCQDGFTAAWAIWKRWPDCEFVPAIYGAPPPDVTGKHVLIVDFSYKRPVLEEMGRAAATITVLDHHKSAEIDLSPFAILNPVNADTIDDILTATQPGLGNIRAQFDMTWSGAHLAWNFAFPDVPPPALIRHVEDRDLWRFDLPFTREIAADLFSRPYDFVQWSMVADMLASPDGFGLIVGAGQAIERKHHKDVAELLRICTRDMIIGGHRVKVANMPYTLSSDAAGELAEGMPFGACYYENSEGKRVFSLRSRAGGIDVSEVAVNYGGGGHASAAGFTAEPGWEGDTAEPDPWLWYAGPGCDPENYSVMEGSREDAIEQARCDFDDGFTICEARKGSLKNCVPDAALIIEQMIERADDDSLFGEDSAGDAWGDTRKAEAELDQLLTAWFDRNVGQFPRPWRFDETRNEEYFPPEPDEDAPESCLACLVPFKDGDRYLPDESGGLIHRDCCGPERESFTKNGGEPLGPDDPIPEGLIWRADDNAAQPLAAPT